MIPLPGAGAAGWDRGPDVHSDARPAASSYHSSRVAHTLQIFLAGSLFGAGGLVFYELFYDGLRWLFVACH